ncbi:Protein CBG28046 [Caenorhabditis briggsae]|uniref:Protein CBG28046 n=1 Tax=Caenorhabditis briggsae TaxID=6238 RepID=B6IGN6_CAEBR|nr:Protein CBG28046 [Caenorhabditis briggsae]CAR99066.1 Protein CBG28046 [Caenorhabditis briggsae]
MLEAITDMVAFYVIAPAAAIKTPAVQISSRAAARQRKLTKKEATPDVPNVIPTEIPSLLSQAIDQDVLLDELVRNRHNRLNTELYDTTLQENDEEDGVVSYNRYRFGSYRLLTSTNINSRVMLVILTIETELYNPYLQNQGPARDSSARWARVLQI